MSTCQVTPSRHVRLSLNRDRCRPHRDVQGASERLPPPQRQRSTLRYRTSRKNGVSGRARRRRSRRLALCAELVQHSDAEALSDLLHEVRAHEDARGAGPDVRMARREPHPANRTSSDEAALEFSPLPGPISKSAPNSFGAERIAVSAQMDSAG